VASKVLIHREVAPALSFAALKLEYFEKTLVTSAGYESLFLVPINNIERSVVGHADLIRSYRGWIVLSLTSMRTFQI
jgi:hypothetical protein